MRGCLNNRQLQKGHFWIARVGAILGAVAAAAAPGLVRADAPAAEEATGPLQEIVVTATRHEEGLSKVPISVTALTQDAMDIRGIKDFQDVARFTPGVNVDNSGTNNISIRGIASSGGAGTTGIYIDDTPIQIRALAFNPDDTLPKAFDVDRIEVLRGPQGTLFGAGSEGGTVRYITTQPLFQALIARIAAPVAHRCVAGTARCGAAVRSAVARVFARCYCRLVSYLT